MRSDLPARSLSLARLSLLLWLGVLSALVHGSADLAAGDQETIRLVVSRQLDAFQRDDEAEAFSYASPTIQAQFRTPAEFMRMVRAGYAAVYRPRSTRFLEVFILNGQVVQPLEVVAADASVLVAFYLMEQQADRTWRISGCMLGAPEGRAT